MTGDNKTFVFYPLLVISTQNLPSLDHKFKHGGEKLKKHHVTMTFVGHLVYFKLKLCYHFNVYQIKFTYLVTYLLTYLLT